MDKATQTKTFPTLSPIVLLIHEAYEGRSLPVTVRSPLLAVICFPTAMAHVVMPARRALPRSERADVLQRTSSSAHALAHKLSARTSIKRDFPIVDLISAQRLVLPDLVTPLAQHLTKQGIDVDSATRIRDAVLRATNQLKTCI